MIRSTHGSLWARAAGPFAGHLGGPRGLLHHGAVDEHGRGFHDTRYLYIRLWLPALCKSSECLCGRTCLVNSRAPRTKVRWVMYNFMRFYKLSIHFLINLEIYVRKKFYKKKQILLHFYCTKKHKYYFNIMTLLKENLHNQLQMHNYIPVKNRSSL